MERDFLPTYLHEQEKRKNYAALYPPGTQFYEEISWAYNEEESVFEVLFCLKGDEEDENIPFLQGRVSLMDFNDHAFKLFDKHGKEVVNDYPDHRGEHVQKESKMSLYDFIEQFKDKILADYIASGEYVDLND